MGWGVPGLERRPSWETSLDWEKVPETPGAPVIGSELQDHVPLQQGGGPRETTSLDQLFSMALATADKPYHLISPPTDRQEVPKQMAPWSSAGRLPCWLGKAQRVPHP